MIKLQKIIAFVLLAAALVSASGCSDYTVDEHSGMIVLDGSVTHLASGLDAVYFDGDTGFADFLSGGGARSDSQVFNYVASLLTSGSDGISLGQNPFGCSTIAVTDENGNSLFGRNFDWYKCDAMILHCVPKVGYSSISTVNTDFVAGVPFSMLPDRAQAIIACYAPLDGMNEMGLCVSVNMIEDGATIEQNTDKPDITTTTAIRLLLDNAADTAQAIELLGQYDMHASMGYMVHFAISDAGGNSVCVEYIDGEMSVVDTPIVTNFYLTEGDKYGVGSSQSHLRYQTLSELLSSKDTFDEDDVRDALDSVSKDNFDGYESTEWSVVYNQSRGEVTYYHRENYSQGYRFTLKSGE